MLSLTRHALKHRHLLLQTSSLYRSYSKSTTTTAAAKPTITKKKYSELPALRVLGSQIVSKTHHARHPDTPECVSLATPERFRLSVNMVVLLSFTVGISSSSSTSSQPLSLPDSRFEPIALEKSSTQAARRRRVRRKDDPEGTSTPESTDLSSATSQARNATAREKRSRKASQPPPKGESCEWRCTSAPECLNL
jgi:hypothetical protein